MCHVAIGCILDRVLRPTEEPLLGYMACCQSETGPAACTRRQARAWHVVRRCQPLRSVRMLETMSDGVASASIPASIALLVHDPEGSRVTHVIAAAESVGDLTSEVDILLGKVLGRGRHVFHRHGLGVATASVS